MSSSQVIRKAVRIVVVLLWALLLLMWCVSPMAQHAIDRHVGFWMLWGFYGILLCLWAVALFMPKTAHGMTWRVRIRLFCGAVVILLGCLIAFLFKGEGLIMSAFFVIVGFCLVFTAVRLETRAKKKTDEIHDA